MAKRSRKRHAQVANLEPLLAQVCVPTKKYVPFFDSAAAPGTYKIDCHVHDNDAEVDANELIGFRRQIDRCVKIAIKQAAQELKEFPKLRDKAKRLLGALAKINRIAEPLLKTDIADELANINEASAPSPVTSYYQTIHALRDVKDHTSALEQELRMITGAPSTSPLVRVLVLQLGNYLVEIRGEQLSKSRTGRLAKLAAAVWTDCKLPADVDLVDFGRFAERFSPHLGRQK